MILTSDDGSPSRASCCARSLWAHPGLTGLKSLLGSVSHAVIQHSDRTVMIVLSPEVAVSRPRGHRALRDPE